MKAASHLWTLFRLHAFANPWMWILPLALSAQAIFGVNHFYGSIWSVFIFFNQALWMPLVVAAMIFLPEFFMGGGWMISRTQQQGATFGADFLLTRAVDRVSIFRCRGLLFWSTILMAVVVWVAAASFRPEISLQLSSRDGETKKAAYYLDHIPGSFVEKTAPNGNVTINAPMGNIQIKVLMAMVMILVASVWVIVLPLIARLPHCKGIYWGLFAVGVGLFPTLTIKIGEAMEPCLVFGLAHLPTIVIASIAVAIAGEWFAEKQLAKLEFM
jgi:hypothetical protein